MANERSPRSHGQGDCYGACGKGCWCCKDVKVRCSERNIQWPRNPPESGTEATSIPVGCSNAPINGFYPFYALTEDMTVCNTPESYALDPSSTTDATYQLCTSRSECSMHDECLGHDAWAYNLFSRCNLLAVEAVGWQAAFGRPAAPWQYQWFLRSGVTPRVVTPDWPS